MLSGLIGGNRDIFFPKLRKELHLITFSEIASHDLRLKGYEPYECETEDEARLKAKELISKKQWPCYFFSSDTTGEKDFEEFFTENENLDMDRFKSIGIIKNNPLFDEGKLNAFSIGIEELKKNNSWSKKDILALYFILLPEFAHKETGKYLDQRM